MPIRKTVTVKLGPIKDEFTRISPDPNVPIDEELKHFAELEKGTTHQEMREIILRRMNEAKQCAQEIFKSEEVTIDEWKVGDILSEYRFGNNQEWADKYPEHYKSTHKNRRNILKKSQISEELYLAAEILFCIQQFERFSVADDAGGASESNPSWFLVHYAMELAKFTEWLPRYRERRDTSKALQAKQSQKGIRVKAIVGAWKNNSLEYDAMPINVVKWRGEESNRTSRERARNDLKAAKKLLPMRPSVAQNKQKPHK